MSQMRRSPALKIGHREFNAYEYALINPMQVDDSQWRDLPSEALNSPAFRVNPEVLPRLVALNEMSDSQREELLARCARWMRNNQAPLLSALMRSDCERVALSAHLVSQMTISFKQQKCWLRFHDPRVFARLSWLLNDVQLRRLFGPITAWAWFDVWADNWHICQRPTRVENAMPGRLEAEQWAALQRLPYLNRCLKQIKQDEQISGDYHSLAKRLDTALHEAWSLGLKDRDDACLYALCIERNGPRWPEVPRIREAIRQAEQGQQSLVRSLADDQHLSVHEIEPVTRYF
ncbi:MAG: DUF4123 domain-containing protein [Stenotrophomonas sp.]|uniref:DUF4123 domain-containing protein n=1 Tax=Stenotrophomonas sp. TaxID=69392 RepID=UPI003D6D8374